MLAFDFETLFPILTILGVFVVFVVIVLVGMRNRARDKRAVASVAAKLGLNFQDAGQALSTRSGREAIIKASDPGTAIDRRQLDRVEQSGIARLAFEILSGLGPWEITGAFRGSEIRIHPVQRGSGRNRKTYTRFEMRFAHALPVALHISKEGFLDRIGKTIFGAQDIEITRTTGAGDDTARRFDEIARVKSKNTDEAIGTQSLENRIRGLLQSPQIQRAVIDVLGEFPETEIEEDGLTLELRGTLTDEKKYRELLDRFAACAREFESQSKF